VTTPTGAIDSGGLPIYGFWHLSDQLYMTWLSRLGFEVVKAVPQKFRCNVTTMESDVWTFVAERRVPLSG
jgi:hypothetical protein